VEFVVSFGGAILPNAFLESSHVIFVITTYSVQNEIGFAELKRFISSSWGFYFAGRVTNLGIDLEGFTHELDKSPGVWLE
jgi:hypothetical protein